MSLFEKIAFWKKDDELDFDKEFGKAETPQQDLFAQPEANVPEAPPERPTALQANAFAPQRNQDLELINSKLDTIRAQLSAIEQRLTAMERSLGTEQKQKLW